MSDPFPPDQPSEEPDVTTADIEGTPVSFVDVDDDEDAEAVLTPDTTLADLDNSGTLETEITGSGEGSGSIATSDWNGDYMPDLKQLDADGDGFFENLILPDGTVIHLDRSGLVTGVEPPGTTVPTSEPTPEQTPVQTPAPTDQTTAPPPVSIPPLPEEEQEQEEDEESGQSGGAELWDDYYKTQSESGFCVPVSVGMVVDAFGEEHTERELVDRALELKDPSGAPLLKGEPGAWKGMSVDGTVQLLDSYGIEATAEQGSLEDLDSYIDDRRGIIVMVDSSEVWTGRDDDSSDRSRGMDHALVVADVKEAQGVVILEDPGNPEGMNYEISLEEFADAWKDSGNQMVVTEEALPEGREDADSMTRPEASVVPRYAGFVIIPVVILGEWILRKSKKKP